MVAWVKRRDKKNIVQAAPYQSAPHPPMTDELAALCARAVHVITPAGEILSAGRASLVVLGTIGWPKLAAFLSRPPMIWFVEAVYRLVARRRGFFSLLFLRRNR